MSVRILVIGSNKDYCSQIKEFFDSRNLISTTVFDYDEGLEKLFFETPHITVIEYTSEFINEILLEKIKASERLQLVNTDIYEADENLYPVFISNDEKIDLLYENIQKALDKINFQSHQSLTEENKESLDSHFFPRLLKQIESEKKTGILTINSNSQIKIYFDNGKPFFAEGGNVETGLARILLKDKKIDLDMYNEVISEVSDGDNNQKTGEILVSKGYVSPHELNSYLELQVKEKIIRGFLSTKGSFSFKNTIDLPKGIYQSKFNIDNIILEGINRYVDISELYNEDLQIQLLPNFNKKITEIGLGPKELRVAQLLNNKTSLNEIYEKSQLNKEEVIKLLFYLAFYEIINLQDVSIDEIGKTSCKKMSEKLDLIDESDLLILDENKIIDDINSTMDEMESLNVEFLEELQLDKGNDGDENNKNENVGHMSDSETNPVDPNLIDLKEDSEQEYLEIINNDADVDLKQVEEDNSGIAETEVSIDREDYNEVIEFYNLISEEDDYYKLLRVSEDAGAEEIRLTYLQLVKKFHPDAAVKYSSEIRDKAEEVFSKLTIAYETLSDENKKYIYDSRSELDQLKERSGDIYEAEVIYREAEALLKQRNYKDAEHKLSKAVELNPDESAYLGSYSWARYCSSDNKDVIFNEVRIKLENAISMDPDLAQNYFYLGSVYKFSDNSLKAKQNFEKAVELDPYYVDAKRELRLLENRKLERKNQKAKAINNERIEKRFWSSLFKK